MTSEQFQKIVSMGAYAIRKGWVVEWRSGHLILHLPDFQPYDKEGKEK